MSKLKKWLDSRKAVRKQEVTLPINTVLSLIKQDFGDGYYNEIMSLIHSKKSFALKKHNYQINSNIDNVLQKCTSEFEKSVVINDIKTLHIEISHLVNNLTHSDLLKAVDEKSWNRITSKHDSDASLKVDHKLHTSNFPLPKEYNDMLSKPEKQPSIKFKQGISAKMVHDISSDGKSNLFMAKPYHKKLESATKSYCKQPITGWSTMTTKALFNAGGIGHLAEDVSAHEHQNVPITIHKFEPKMYTLAQQWDTRGLTINPLDVQRIGVMDYLTNNLDRHGGNIMFNDSEYNDDGYHKLLAIDHERNFQYIKHKAGSYKEESPLTYINDSGLWHLHKTSQGWYSHEDLVDWWNKHGEPIKGELEKNLSAITDDSLRSHVRDNFNKRWHKMNDWAKHLSTPGNIPDEMYNEDHLGSDSFAVHNIKQETPKITAKQLKLLPQNPKDALFSICDIINKKGKLTQPQRYLLSNAQDEIFKKMTPDQVADTFRSILENPYMQTNAIKGERGLDPRLKMLNFFADPQGWNNNNPIYRTEHMNSLAQIIDSLPSEHKEILGYWADHYRNLLKHSERQAG